MTDQIERVVLERLPEGTPNDNPEHYTEEDGCFNPCPGCDPDNIGGVYRRIPDPVPALQARIAELEGELSRLKVFAGRVARSGHSSFCSCYECETVRVMCPAEGQYDRQGKWQWKPPTPAAAKEQ